MVCVYVCGGVLYVCVRVWWCMVCVSVCVGVLYVLVYGMCVYVCGGVWMCRYVKVYSMSVRM